MPVKLFTQRSVLFLALIVLSWFFGSGVRAESERFYQERFCAGLPIDQHLRDGSEADCIRPDVAIEVDFSDHWAAAIGQSLHYGAVLGIRPGIILVCREETAQRVCLRHQLRLTETLSYWNIGVMVWLCDSKDEALAECQFTDFFSR